MTTTDSLYTATSFGEFWEHYREIHAHPRTRALHAVGTATALGMLGLAVARRSLVLALLAPIVDHAIAQWAHRRIAQVATHPLRRPWWHARAEWRLFRTTLRDAEQALHDRM